MIVKWMRNVCCLIGLLLSFTQLCDMKVFVDTDPDIRLARRLSRDITERGRDLDSVLKQYMKFVKPSYDHCIAPTMRHADIIVPRGMYDCWHVRDEFTFKFP